MRVFVAMSGGVDSSVAAALLKQEGYEVIGATMEIFPDYEQPSEGDDVCCSLSAVEDAKRVADMLNIPHYTINLKKDFQKEVINNFVEEYSNARTPNPCVVCNNEIKFKSLLRKALEIDCDYLATGHYARITHNKQGRHLLKKGIDQDKDQTYMLYGLNQYQLEHTIMPLGEYTKDKVRKLAKDIGLKVHNKSDSQEICFVPDDDYTRFLNENYPDISEPGPIYDTEGNKLGEHSGLHNYTIGQRRGLGISMPYPVYVVKLDVDNNALIVGKNEKVFSRGLLAEDLNWISIKDLEKPIDVRARIRYNAPEIEARLYPGEGNTVRVMFAEKQRAVTPGQSAVFYQNELVVGGGIIKKGIN